MKPSATVQKRGAIAILQAAKPGVHKAVFRGLIRGATIVSKEAKMLVMKGPKTGRLYGTAKDIEKIITNAKKGFKAASKRVHQASAAGEPPATDTGALVRSISVLRGVNSTIGKPVIYVQATARYAKWLEYGTRKTAKHPGIKERPFIRPAVRNKKKEVIACINQELKSYVQDRSRR